MEFYCLASYFLGFSLIIVSLIWKRHLDKKYTREATARRVLGDKEYERLKSKGYLND